MENLSSSDSNKKYSILKNIFNKDFVVSAIILIIIFSVFDKMEMTLNGIILSGAWSLGVILINFMKERKINALVVMGASFAGIGVIGIVISKNHTFYFVAPIILNILLALIFFGSLFLEKSLIQIIVELSYLKMISEESRKRPNYKSVWRIVTIAWGVLSVSQAVLRVILLYSVSMSSYYAISTLYGISTPLFLAFSMAFPAWYWKRTE